MLERRHLEQAPPVGDAEVGHLEQDRGGDAGGDDGDHGQQGPLARHQRHDGQRRPERERSGVPHEELGGVDVVPEEGEQGADDGEAEAEQEDLPLQRGDDAIGGEGHRRNQPCQSVQPIGQRNLSIIMLLMRTR